jgi:hypothetical protein
MSDLDLTELRRLAEGATPGPKGPWRVEADPGQECSECGTHESEGWIVRRSDGAGVAVVLVDDRDEVIARYIAAASPSVVLALLDRVERAEKAEAVLRDAEWSGSRGWGPPCCPACEGFRPGKWGNSDTEYEVGGALGGVLVGHYPGCLIAALVESEKP